MKRIFLLAALSLSTLTSFAQASMSGSGTESDPYKIFYSDQLHQVRNYLNQSGVYFKLMNNIDLTEWNTTNNPGQGWEPIGVVSAPFKGVFDGNDKTITGFSITRSSTDYVGLFGYISGATIKNLTIEGDVSGRDYVGAFVGGSPDNPSNILTGLKHIGSTTGNTRVGGIAGVCYGNISNMTVQGNVSGTQEVGGAFGRYGSGTDVTNTTMTGVTVTGDVTSTGDYVGGIAGYTTSPITDVSYMGKVTGVGYVGGIVGDAHANIGVANASGSVNGKGYVGGICGRTSGGDLTNSYAQCDVNGTGDYVGGILGEGFANITHCSFFGNVSGASYVGGVLGGINDQAFPEFIYVYRISKSSYSDESSYDSFQGTTTSSSSKSISNCYAVGDVKGSGDYIGGICGYSYNNCSWSKTPKRTITLFDSDNKHYIRKKGVSTTTTGTFTTYNYTCIYESFTLTDNYFSGYMTGKNYVGGIVGLGNSVTIKQNYSNANINGTNYVGGIVAKIMSEKAGYYPYNSSSVTYVDAPSNPSVLKSNMAVNTSVIATTCAGRIYGSKEGGESVTVGVNGNAAEDNRALYEGTLVISGVTQEVVDSEQNGVNNGAAYFKLKANYVSHGWDFNSKWTNQETETYPYKPWQAAPPTITGSLVSGDTSISGNSTDGGTIYIKIGKGKEQSTVCSGTTFTLTGIEPLKSGSIVQLYTKTSGKEASYINQYTVGYPGSGTEADPWRVYSAEDLQGVYKAGYYKQMNDIDLTSWISANSATKGWVPVGYNGNGTIVYDGDNHKITGLWTNTTDSYTGLFSSINNGTIKNLTLQLNAKKVKGGGYTGALIGRIGAGSIENVTVTGNVQGDDNTGGIVGYSPSTTLENLSYSGQVTGSGATGGITAYASGQPVTACQVTASTVKSTGGNVGGLIAAGNASVSQCKVTGTTVSQTGTGSGIYVAGLTANVTGAITQCLVDATISNASAGGYTAGLAAKSSAKIKECSATGSVTSTGSNAKTGGLVAETTSGSSIEDCYSTASVSGTQYTAGLVGYNYGKVNRCYASGNVSSTYYGSGLVGYNNGASAVVTNCVALGSKVEVSDQSGWGIRVIGGYTNGAPDPDESNYAWRGMQISENGIPKQIQDNIQDGQSLSDSEIKLRDSYEALYWDFDNVWAMPADGYPVLQWQLESSEPEVVKGDLNDDGKVSISDVVLIIDVIAGTITDANKVAAADVNGDGKESISDCVAAIDLIATQTSTPSSARRKANAMLSNTDFLTAAMQENVLSISLASERRYTAFQMTVSVPEGMTLGCATMDEMCGADHLLTVRDLGGGRYLVAGFSADNNELSGNSGRLLTLSTEGQTAEDIVISDIEFATTQAEAYYLADVTVGGTPTGIKAIENGKWKMGNGVYDLQGRRVTKATKGIYMYNGKKTIIK